MAEGTAHNPAVGISEGREQAKFLAARDHLARVIQTGEDNLARLEGKAARWAELAELVAQDSAQALETARAQLAHWRQQLAGMGG
ncbi:MAG: hypothetical protein PHQ28_10045 [Mycobacterium sp.]|jgi:hypothetical protein|nr:hypothetical protein [Mycobacterium sp.]